MWRSGWFVITGERWLGIFKDEAGDVGRTPRDVGGDGGTKSSAIDHDAIRRNMPEARQVTERRDAIGISLLLRGMSCLAGAETLIVECKYVDAE